MRRKPPKPLQEAARRWTHVEEADATEAARGAELDATDAEHAAAEKAEAAEAHVRGRAVLVATCTEHVEAVELCATVAAAHTAPYRGCGRRRSRSPMPRARSA